MAVQHKLIWRCLADFVDVSHFWPLSLMAAVPINAVAPDPEDLRDKSTVEVIELHRDLKGLGYDVDDLPDVLRETHVS
jgi:hypothetical protein